MKVDVIICNLTRLGDLVQSQPLINDLNSAGFSVGLVCLENFAMAADLLKNVSAVWPLRGARLLADSEENWPLAIEELLDYTDRIKEEAEPRYVINLTPSLPARLLTKLLAKPSTTVLGFGMDELGFGLNVGMWTQFFAVAAQKRINAPFNLSDMLRRIAFPVTGNFTGNCYLKSPEENYKAWAREFLSSISSNAGYVAFQLGASEERRRWPVERFVELGNILHREAGITPVLLGSDAESPLSEKYAALADHPYINAIGRTTLPQLAALLQECRLLVTNDTGTMHLASGLNVPGLAIFLATAQPVDTGPLLEGFCCLEPALDCHPCAFGRKCGSGEQCRSAIKARTVADLVIGWLKTNSWEAGLMPHMAEECRIWVTGKDSAGFSKLRSLTGHDKHGRGLWFEWMRVFWGSLLDGLSRKDTPPPGANAWKGLPLPKKAEKLGRDIRQAVAIMDSIWECGVIAKKNPRAGQLFLRNCERLQAVFDTAPGLATLAAFWREVRHNQGDDLDRFLPVARGIREHLAAFGNALAPIGT